ncbi:MAG TPA: DUF4157 domain-containing protein, partial [Acidimicrobiales bacterium]|nr:DUF4157 domain-containing protein [Acidimicrobiales bacterium]
MAPPIVHEALRSSGRPLGDQDRRRFETQLGIGLADVRLHTDGLAAASSKAVGAEAYTAGSHVVFGRGAYAPDSPGGQRLLAHELAHVAQQGAGGGLPAQLEVGRSDDPAEHEAERFAE